MRRNKPLILTILDGWGFSPIVEGNAIAAARKPTYDRLVREYPYTLIHTSGPYVGLPEGQVADPVFVAGDEIDFHGQLNRQLRVIAAGLLNFGDVLSEVLVAHVPIIPVIARHRIVLRETDLGKAQLDRLRRQINRIAHRVAAQARVHVIISRKRHCETKLIQPPPPSKTNSPPALVTSKPNTTAWPI